MRLLAGSIQAESRPSKEALVFDQERIDVKERASIAYETECVFKGTEAADDVSELTMKRGFPAGETQVFHFAQLSFKQDFVDDFHRKVSAGGVPFLETMMAAQIASIGQFDDDACHVASLRFTGGSKRTSVIGS